MTETVIRQALRDSLHEVLEKMFFVDAQAEPALPEPPSPPVEEIAVRVLFRGDPPGCFAIRLGCAAASEIAANFLGIDPREVSDLQASEVARELANMVCGSVLSRLESATAFRLETPEIVPPGEESAATDSIVRLSLTLDKGKLTASLALDTARCPDLVQSAY